MVDHFHRTTMGRAVVKRRKDGLVWIVGSGTIGSGIDLTVDDVKGAVLEVGRWDIR